MSSRSRNTGLHVVTGRVDAGWQKRGSGRSYNSLSGHSSFIGKHSGKVQTHAVRSKTCAKRASAEKKVFRKLKVSPGSHTTRLPALKDRQEIKQRQYQSTTEAKRLRRQNKDKSSKPLACLEVREGPTYQCGIDLEADVNVDQIPPPMYPPTEDPLILEDSDSIILFDLETTGLERDSHITEIAALTVKSGESFHRYILPDKPIHQSASLVTGITARGSQLFKDGRPVNSVKIREALTDFLNFLKPKLNVILSAHNCKVFDSLVLVNALINTGMLKELMSVKFQDTLKIFEKTNPGLKTYGQENLVKTLLGINYSAHGAAEDVKALLALYNSVNISHNIHNSSLFSIDYAVSSLQHSLRVKSNLPSLKVMLQKKDKDTPSVLSDAIARKIACSGLQLKHIRTVYARNGKNGVRSLLSEELHGKVRVTTCKRIIDNICNFLLGV